MKSRVDTRIRVYADLEELSQAAADFFVKMSREASTSKGGFAVAISGGSTPRRFLSLLAASTRQERISWTSTHIFWADERCVPPGHPDSNYKLAHEALLSKIPIRDENVHRIKGEENSVTAARDYEESLRLFFGTQPLPVFDLIILGAGADGHTASLFPGSAAVHERRRIALPIHAEAPKPDRVTLTLPVLNNASQVFFLVSGREKAAILHEIMEDGNPKHCPAGLVKPVHGHVTWLIDREAASLLSEQTFPR